MTNQVLKGIIKTAKCCIVEKSTEVSKAELLPYVRWQEGYILGFTAGMESATPEDREAARLFQVFCDKILNR